MIFRTSPGGICIRSLEGSLFPCYIIVANFHKYKEILQNVEISV